MYFFNAKLQSDPSFVEGEKNSIEKKIFVIAGQKKERRPEIVARWRHQPFFPPFIPRHRILVFFSHERRGI